MRAGPSNDRCGQNAAWRDANRVSPPLRGWTKVRRLT